VEDAMKKMSSLRLFAGLLGAVVLCAGANASRAQGQPPPDHPAVTVKGQTYTPRSILARNMGTPADQTTQFPPHKIIGNIYYVGTTTLSSFLVVTPQGNILIDSTYERNVPTIEKSVTQLGFKFSDIKILLGNHAHGDHQEGDALVKQMTGAQTMAMAEDVPALQAMKPGGKEHPIDKVLHDAESVTLGGTTLVAHLTPGHTRGCTTWTTTAQEGGKTYNVMFGCSLRPPAVLTPALVDEFNRAFKTVRALPCDVQLGDHGAQYNMQEKYARFKDGGVNPFIDPATCTLEADIEEAMFHAILAEQQQAARP
jgi:metallo-beta-lactamase class B